MSRPQSVLEELLKAARGELHDAQRIAAMLSVDTDGAPQDAVAVARNVIERDLAARRVEAWAGVIDRLRNEARVLGLFDL